MPQVTPDAKGLTSVFLQPGGVVVADRPVLICTVLGSCVSVCIHSVRLRIGAMSHSLLPYWSSTIVRNPLNYVDKSVFHMLRELAKYGVTAGELTVKLFGGADMIEVLHERGGVGVSVGTRNIEAAREAINSAGLFLQSEKVGGNRGYKLWFYSDTGEVLLKRLGRTKIKGVRLNG